MNPLNWIKRNPIVAAFFVLFAAALAGLAWLSREANAKRDAVEADLQAQRNALSRILESRPAPLGDNLRILKKDREQLEGHYRDLLQDIVGQRIEMPESLTPIEFSKRVDQAAGRIRYAAEQSKIRLPENFRLGFARYEKALPCQQTASGDDCKRILTMMIKQLAASQKICTLLINAGVEEIRGIRRVDVEPATGAGPDALDAVISVDPRLQSVHFPFECQFVCGTEQLRSLLNEIPKQDVFFAVRGLRIDEERVAGGVEYDPATRSKTTTEGRKRLMVSMRIEFVEFPEPGKAPAARR